MRRIRCLCSYMIHASKVNFFTRSIAFETAAINRLLSSQIGDKNKHNAPQLETQHPSSSDSEYANNLEIRMSTPQLDFDEV